MLSVKCSETSEQLSLKALGKKGARKYANSNIKYLCYEMWYSITALLNNSFIDV